MFLVIKTHIYAIYHRKYLSPLLRVLNKNKLYVQDRFKFYQHSLKMALTDELKNDLFTNNAIKRNRRFSESVANTRTVATLCGSWRSCEEDGGFIFVSKNRNPCLSPDPVREIDLPENAIDVWEENQIFETIQNGVSCNPEGTQSIVKTSCEKRKADVDDDNKETKRPRLEAKGSKAKRPGFSDDRFNETSYYIENGLRKVYPYYFTFTTYTKGRWVGDAILDVFSREFRAAPAAVYESCIREGRLTVNGEKVDPDYKLKHNDLLANVVHRHEVPVTSQPITFVHIDEDLVVINKPSSIPVHPCGRYRHNTVVYILAKDYNLPNLRTIHRLDRLTSGLLLFSRNAKRAQLLEQQIRSREVEKEYLCRVVGEFPEEEIDCNDPIEVVSYKIGVCKVSAKGKDCSTLFKRIGYNPKTNCSVVLCRPKTGRMHQIRVHLQYLGFPIVNDPLYNHELFGPLCGKGGDFGGKTDEQLIKELIRVHNAETWLGEGDDMLFPKLDIDKETCLPNGTETTVESKKVPDFSRSRSSVPEEPPLLDDKSKRVSVATQTGQTSSGCPPIGSTYDPSCPECKVRYRDPEPKDLVMYLHAWKYKGPDWSFETEPPQWANVEWEHAGNL